MNTILIDGLLVRPGDKAHLETYWVVVDQRGRLLGVALNQERAEALATQLAACVVPPVRKSTRNTDPLGKLIREALDEC